MKKTFFTLYDAFSGCHACMDDVAGVTRASLLLHKIACITLDTANIATHIPIIGKDQVGKANEWAQE